jgi:hypothetical protein
VLPEFSCLSELFSFRSRYALLSEVVKLSNVSAWYRRAPLYVVHSRAGEREPHRCMEHGGVHGLQGSADSGIVVWLEPGRQRIVPGPSEVRTWGRCVRDSLTGRGPRLRPGQLGRPPRPVTTMSACATSPRGSRGPDACRRHWMTYAKVICGREARVSVIIV